MLNNQEIKKLYEGKIFDPIKHPEEFPYYDSSKKNNNLGTTNKTPFKIIEYIDSRNVKIKFLDKRKLITKSGKVIIEGGYESISTLQHIKKNSLKNPYQPTIENIAYIGSAFDSVKNYSSTHSYVIWHGIIKRCYNEKELQKLPSYRSVSVSRSWRNFSNFLKFYNKNYYVLNGERMNIDKDILVKKNKVYGSKYCAFIPERINKAIINNELIRSSDTPIGVKKACKNGVIKYYGCIDRGGKRQQGSYTSNIEEAFQWYKEQKENYLKELAEEYKGYFLEEYGEEAFNNNKFKFKSIYESLLNYNIEIDD